MAAQAEAAEAAASELGERTDRQVAAQLEAAGREAEELMAQAREECRSMVEEAQGLRARVLADLSKRRKVLHAQIEQLRAGRERLAETVQDVRRSVDAIADDLFAAEDNARLAAEAAGREALDRPDEGTPEELAALLLADEAEAGGEDGESPDVVAAHETGQSSKRSSHRGGRSGCGPTKRPDQRPTRGRGCGGRDATGADRSEAVGGVADREGADDGRGRGRVAGRRPLRQDPRRQRAARAFAAVARCRREGGQGQGRSRPGAGATGRSAADPAADAQSVAEDEAEGEPEDGSSDDGPPDERDPLAVRRDELIAPIVTALARRLKRTLQDNQNDLLDSLRSSGSHWSSELLPDETEQVDSCRHRRAPRAGAGRRRPGSRSSDVAPGKAPHADALVKIAHELAESVVGPLRRRLLDDDGLEDADESVVAEHVGSAFREWKGERIERLAGDHVRGGLLGGVHVGGGGHAPRPSSSGWPWPAPGMPPAPIARTTGSTAPSDPGRNSPPATCIRRPTPGVDASCARSAT